MTQIQSSAAPDTTDMLAIHSVFRQALAEASLLVHASPPADVVRAPVVGSYYDNVLRFLRVHHAAEDALVWPTLLERCPADADLIRHMVSSHETIHAALDHADACVRAWIASADTEASDRLTTALAELRDSLIPHLDEEEARIVPLCAEYLTFEEWGQMPGYAMAHFDGDKIWLIMGLIRQHMTPSQRSAMLDHMPPPPRDMWINMGKAAFDGFITDLRKPTKH